MFQFGTSSVNNNNSTPVNDTNVNLGNLGIRPHDFSGFKSGSTSYSVTVPNDCTSIEVYAVAQSQSAKISGTGTKSLKEGTNAFDVTVSNGGASKKYRINVTRSTSGDEIPPNVIDDEEQEEEEKIENPGIGLSTLEIAGYELDKEFKTDVYDYVVRVNGEITLTELEEIKEKMLVSANNENVSIEIMPEVLENGNGVINIIVKDAEKEYAHYTIKFVNAEQEKEEDTTPVVTGASNNNNGSGNSGIFGLSIKHMIGIMIACYGITLFFAVFFAINCYLKNKRLNEYEEDDEQSDNSEFDKMNKYYEGVKGNQEDTNEKIDTLEDNEKQDEHTDLSSRLKKLNGYRNLRRIGKSSGRHF